MTKENPYREPRFWHAGESHPNVEDCILDGKADAWDEGYHSRDEEVAVLEDKVAAAANLASMTLGGIEARQQARDRAKP